MLLLPGVYLLHDFGGDFLWLVVVLLRLLRLLLLWLFHLLGGGGGRGEAGRAAHEGGDARRELGGVLDVVARGDRGHVVPKWMDTQSFMRSFMRSFAF